MFLDQHKTILNKKTQTQVMKNAGRNEKHIISTRKIRHLSAPSTKRGATTPRARTISTTPARENAGDGTHAYSSERPRANVPATFFFSLSGHVDQKNSVALQKSPNGRSTGQNKLIQITNISTYIVARSQEILTTLENGGN